MKLGHFCQYNRLVIIIDNQENLDAAILLYRKNNLYNIKYYEMSLSHNLKSYHD